MGIKAGSWRESRWDIQDGTALPSQGADACIPHLSNLCRSILLLQLPQAHTPTVSTAACPPLGLRLSIIIGSTPLIKLFKHNIHRDSRIMRHKNYKKTMP